MSPFWSPRLKSLFDGPRPPYPHPTATFLHTHTLGTRNSGISVEHVDQLRFDVDRLRRERDDARAEAMRWLEQEKAKLEANAQATALAEVHKQRSAAAAAGSVQEMGAVGDLGMVVDANGKRDNSAKAAAAIAKLRAKVERLRKERDEAEDQAAKWLNEQQANLRQQLAADMSMNGVMNDQDRADSVSRDEVLGGVGGVGFFVEMCDTHTSTFGRMYLLPFPV